MIIKRIEGSNRVLGKSQGYLGLPVRDDTLEDGTPVMVTAWEPTPDELESIAAGGAIYVRILGRQHPPISVEVEKIDGQ